MPPAENESGPLKGRCAQNLWDIKVLREYTFYMRMGADHNLMASSINGLKDTRLISDEPCGEFE